MDHSHSSPIGREEKEIYGIEEEEKNDNISLNLIAFFFFFLFFFKAQLVIQLMWYWLLINQYLGYNFEHACCCGPFFRHMGSFFHKKLLFFLQLLAVLSPFNCCLCFENVVLERADL